MSVRRLLPALFALGLFLSVLGVKAVLIARFGSDLPYWDQWVKEGEMIIAPYYEGTLRLHDFFVPHNEHRIAPTLVLNLALTVFGGQWDARVECVVNAGLHAAVILGLVWFAWRAAGRRYALGLAWGLVAVDLSGLAWENTLGGFQSQFSFVTGFSLLAIHGMLAPGGPRRVRWWLGLGCVGLASVSMGSGFLAVVPVGAIAALRLASRRRPRWPDAATLVVTVAACLAGWAMRAPAPWHKPIHAQGARDLIVYILQCLAWPHPSWIWPAALLWLPWTVLLAKRLRGQPVGSHADVVLAGGFWVLLQVLALAYARGAAATLPASRYGDVIVVGLVYNLVAYAQVQDGSARRVRSFLLPAWIAAALGGLLLSAVPVWRTDLPDVGVRNRLYEENVRKYLFTGDFAALIPDEVPLPNSSALQAILDRPAIRALMPVSVRPPLPLPADPARTHGFAPNDFSPATPLLKLRTAWGSFASPRPAAWASAPVVPHFGYWKFETAGQPGAPGVTLQLASPEGTPRSPPIAPDRVPEDGWIAAYVPVPASPGGVIVTAAVSTPAHWLGFSEPVEVSALSVAFRRIVGHATLIATIGGILLLFVSVLPPRFRSGGGRTAK